MALYLSVDQLLALHEAQVEHYGGDAGVRDRGGVEASAARPAMTFGGEDLYPDVPAKAAALLHAIVTRHPFVDGNKRTGLHAALLFIAINGWNHTLAPDEVERVTQTVARGEMDIEPLTIWLRQRVTPPR